MTISRSIHHPSRPRTTPGFSRMMLVLSALVIVNIPFTTLRAFEGRITATLTRGGVASPLLYTADTNYVRVEITNNNWPHAVNILDRQGNELTLLFPNNRTFVRFQPDQQTSGDNSAPFPSPGMVPGPALQMPGGPGTAAPALPQMSQMPNAMLNAQMPPGMAAMPATLGPSAMPVAPPVMDETELTITGDKTNLLGYPCIKYQLKQSGEIADVWATDQLFPFQPYLQIQPHHFEPRALDTQWGELFKARNLFPLSAILKSENGVELCRFEVNSIQTKKIADVELFQPPASYRKIQSLPF